MECYKDFFRGSLEFFFLASPTRMSLSCEKSFQQFFVHVEFFQLLKIQVIQLIQLEPKDQERQHHRKTPRRHRRFSEEGQLVALLHAPALPTDVESPNRPGCPVSTWVPKPLR